MKRGFILVILIGASLCATGCERSFDTVSPVSSEVSSVGISNTAPTPEISNTIIPLDTEKPSSDIPESNELIPTPVATSPSSSKEPIKNATSPFYYDATKVKVGDVINGMEVIDVSLTIDPEVPGDEGLDYNIQFKGEFEITGTIEVEDALWGIYVMRNSSYLSDVMPYSSFEEEIDNEKEEFMRVNVYISNEEDLITEMKKVNSKFEKGDQAQIKAVFSSYRFNIWGFEYSHWAKFEKIIEIY